MGENAGGEKHQLGTVNHTPKDEGDGQSDAKAPYISRFEEGGIQNSSRLAVDFLVVAWSASEEVVAAVQLQALSEVGEFDHLGKEK